MLLVFLDKFILFYFVLFCLFVCLFLMGCKIIHTTFLQCKHFIKFEEFLWTLKLLEVSKYLCYHFSQWVFFWPNNWLEFSWYLNSQKCSNIMKRDFMPKCWLVREMETWQYIIHEVVGFQSLHFNRWWFYYQVTANFV